MNNKDIHIGIVGAGIIGSTIYQLLVSNNKSYTVSIADILDYQQSLIAEEDYVKLTQSESTTDFQSFVDGKTLIINALPYTENINLYKSCFDLGVAYFDLSESANLDEYINSELSGKELPYTLPHCGLAPGMSSIVAFDLVKRLEKPQTLKIRVGALSQNAGNKLRYYSSWSGDGLVNEYIGDCQVVRKGHVKKEKALTGYERLNIGGIEYEAFNTSGGIGSLAKSIEVHWNPYETGSSIFADYKTLRRIGHHDYVDFLFNDLQLDKDTLTAIFKACIPSTRQDEVIIYVSASSDLKEDEHTYYKVFKPRVINGRRMTAIEYTTAIGCIAQVERYLNDCPNETGYKLQEDSLWNDLLKTSFGYIYREDERL